MYPPRALGVTTRHVCGVTLAQDEVSAAHAQGVATQHVRGVTLAHTQPDFRTRAVCPASVAGDAPLTSASAAAQASEHGNDLVDDTELHDLSQRKAAHLAQAQCDDVTIKHIYENGREHGDNGNQRKYDGFVLVQGVLYHLYTVKHGDGTHTYRRLVLPDSYRLKVLNDFHASNLTGGHLGATKTYSKLLPRYYWPNMYHQMHEFVRACEQCERRHAAPTPVRSRRALCMHRAHGRQLPSTSWGCSLCPPRVVTSTS